MIPEQEPLMKVGTEHENWFYVLNTLAKLDTKMDSLIGNGQPGRVQKLEDRVQRHDIYFGTVLGVSIVLGTLAKFWDAIKHLFSH